MAQWVLAFGQGRGRQGFTEDEALKLTNLGTHLYRLFGMSRDQVSGFCYEIGQRSPLGSLDTRLAELDSLYDQMADSVWIFL